VLACLALKTIDYGIDPATPYFGDEAYPGHTLYPADVRDRAPARG
jgi:hypothetical protein